MSEAALCRGCNQEDETTEYNLYDCTTLSSINKIMFSKIGCDYQLRSMHNGPSYRSRATWQDLVSSKIYIF